MGPGFFSGKTMKKRATVFVDGFNLYHSIQDTPAFHKYKWLNLQKLSMLFMKSNEELVDILYFSALAHWNSQKVAKHTTYIRALRTVGVKTILSEFKRKDRRCTECGKVYKTFEEKQTDTHIAIQLFQKAVKDEYDKAIIMSGDSDLMPAVEALHSIFPKKEIYFIFPYRRVSEQLKKLADGYSRIRERHLASSQFDDVIYLDDEHFLKRPENWL